MGLKLHNVSMFIISRPRRIIAYIIAPCRILIYKGMPKEKHFMSAAFVA